MGEKIIQGHLEGETQEQRAWFNFWNITAKVNQLIHSEQPLSKREKKKLYFQAKKAANIRTKYDAPAEPPVEQFTMDE